MNSIYRSGDYPLYYAALVADMNSQAVNRLDQDYNYAGVPSCFFDGGYEVLVGGYEQESYYRTRIENCGARTIPQGLDMILRIDSTGYSRVTTKVRVSNGAPANVAPATPTAPSGPAQAPSGQEVVFEVLTTDDDGDQVFYEVDFGDNSKSTGWTGPYDEGSVIEFAHTYETDGAYQISVRSMDIWDFDTPWSDSAEILIDCCVVRGDVSPDGEVNIQDLLFLVSFMFSQGPAPECETAADINGNGVGPDIEDLFYLVTYMFGEGPAPVPCSE